VCPCFHLPGAVIRHPSFDLAQAGADTFHREPETCDTHLAQRVIANGRRLRTFR
jgi:hypothetical protein